MMAPGEGGMRRRGRMRMRMRHALLALRLVLASAAKCCPPLPLFFFAALCQIKRRKKDIILCLLCYRIPNYADTKISNIHFYVVYKFHISMFSKMQKWKSEKETNQGHV